MGGLIFIAVIISWLWFCVWLARKVVSWIPIESGGLKGLIGLLTFAVLLPLPLIDEIIGKFQFDKLCREEAGVKVYGKLELGPEFFCSDGTPNLFVTCSKGDRRLNELIKAVVEFSDTKFKKINSTSDISRGNYRIIDKRSGEVLAEFTGYNNGGGWLAIDHHPWLTKPECYPPETVVDILRRIVIQTNKESRK